MCSEKGTENSEGFEFTSMTSPQAAAAAHAPIEPVMGTRTGIGGGTHGAGGAAGSGRFL